MRGMAMTLMAVCAAGTAAMASGGNAGSDQRDDQIVCKQQQKAGTRFATRTCHTRAEWETIIEHQRRGAREMLDQRIINTCREEGNCGKF